MKKNLISIVFVLLLSLASCSFTSNKFSSDKEKLLLEVIRVAIEKWHYQPSEVNDELSKKVYKMYLGALDSHKRYFLQSDIDEFKKYETLLDDQLKNKDISFFDLTNERLLQRMKEAENLFKEEIKKPFDFSKNESIQTDYKKMSYAKNEDDLRERWRKVLKFSVLSNYVIREKEELTKKEKDKNYKIKTSEEIKKESVESTQKAFENLFLSYKDLEREDWFGIFANSFVEVIDPHTNYMSPDLKERFKSDMSGTFEGIGARLQKRTEGIRIADIIMGGPVWKSKQIEVGDLILKVGQNDNKPPVDVTGMRLDDAIKLIKGKKGTQVKLTIKKVDGTIEVITLTRDIVEIEETFVKSVLVSENNSNYGIIEVPKFYTDFDNPKGRNVATDMASEIEKLKAQNVKGLVIDLRNNGGGSLPAVVKIAGLFIKNGPVVQVRQANGKIQVLEDEDTTIQWDKPVVILVNELSASASEILAAALQDYQRAIVIGGKSTFGKGTVQSVVDIKRDIVTNTSFSDLGLLKITMQKFYRINGGSTQLKGVLSDIEMPDKYKYVSVGEKEAENAMLWDKISPADYKKWNKKIDFSQIISKSKERIQANENFKLVDENAKWIKSQSDESLYSLNYKTYKKQVEEDEQKAKKFKVLSNYKSHLNFVSLPEEENLTQTDKDFKLRRDRWFENLSKDIYLEEAVFVLKDLLK